MSTSGARPRRGRPGYDQRGVLDGAVELFNLYGYDATTMDMLAAHLGLSKGAIYHHVSSKEQLLELALDRALTAIEEVLADSQDRGDAVSRLVFLMEGAVDALIRELPTVTLLLRLRGNSEIERAALERRRAFDVKVTGLIAEAQSDGTIRTDIPPAIAERMLFGMLNSLIDWYRPGAREDGPHVAADMLKVTLDGLRTP
jgi:AcrR family transcriptional regulator